MVEVNNRTRQSIDLKLVRRTASLFLRAYGLEGRTVSIVFVGEKLIRRVNRKYRNKDRVTDVLSFEGEEDSLGEILICYAQVRRQAGLYSSSVREELVFILVHGLLHLLGYDDDSEAGRGKMISLGREFINKHSLC